MAAKEMKAYEDAKFDEWRVHVEEILPELLKANLLIKPKHNKNSNIPVLTSVDQETGIIFKFSY
jgi:hypothetical protein